MIDPQAESIKRLMSLAKSGAQRTPLNPRFSSDPAAPDLGLLWIRTDEKKAYIKVDEETTLLVASAEPTGGGDGGSIDDRSIPGEKLMLNTVTTDELASNSVTELELAAGAVTGSKFADFIDAITSMKLYGASPASPALTLDVDFDHAGDVFRVLRDGVQRFRVDSTHVSIGTDLAASAVSMQTAGNDTVLRLRGGGGAILAEKTNGQLLFSVDGSGNATFGGSISSLAGNSGTAGSLAIQGALTVTNQGNFLAGVQVAGDSFLLSALGVSGIATFAAEPVFPSSYTAKLGGAAHIRTDLPAHPNRVILEGVSDVNKAELQLGTGGPVLRGSLAESDRMYIGTDRVVTSAASGLIGTQIAYDTITGGNGPGVGNIAAETVYGYNIKNASITSTELSPGAVVAAAIAAGAVGEVALADGSVIDRVVASLGVGKLVSGTLNADEVFMGPSGHIYLGPTDVSEILDERIQIDSSGIRSYNAFNTPLAEFTPGGFTLRTGDTGERLEFDAANGIELFGLTGERTGYLSPLGEFQLDSLIDGARMSLNSQDGIQFIAGATRNLAFNPGFIGSSECETAVAGEAYDDQRHVFAGEYAVKFRGTNPNPAAPSYVDVPFKNTVGTGTSPAATRYNKSTNPGLDTTLSGWEQSSPLYPVPPVITSLTEDFEDTTYVTTISGPWTRVNTTPQSGSWCFKASTIGNSASSVATFVVPANATQVQFWYRVSSEVNDFFRFAVNGVQQMQASGTSAVWTQSAAYAVVPGQNITFTYIKNAATTGGSDTVWIDNVTFTISTPQSPVAYQNFTRESVLGFVKSHAAQLQATSTGPAAMRATSLAVSGLSQWAFSCSVRASVAQYVQARIVWFDVTSEVIQTDSSSLFSLFANRVMQIGLVKVAPSNAVTAKLEIYAPTLNNTDTLQVSDVLYEQTSAIRAFFDGDSEGYQWDGSPGISTSSLIPVPIPDTLDNLLSIYVWSDVACWVQIEGRDSTLNLGRGTSSATPVVPNQWTRVQVQCTGVMDKVRLHNPSKDQARQNRITVSPIWWSGVQVEADREIATPFCAGGEPGCSWEGLEAKSASVRAQDTIVTRISPTLGTAVSGAIVGGSLTSASFFAGRIFGTYIQGGRIVGNIIEGNQINGDQILANTINGNAITARSILADKIATATLTATEIAAATITGTNIAADTITTTNLTARLITADKLQADLVLSSRIIAGAAATGARVEMTAGTGLQAFTAAGVRTFFLNSTNGSAFFMGELTTASTGTRIVINPGSSAPDAIRFYQDNTNYCTISAEPAGIGSGASCIIRSQTISGRLGAVGCYPGEAFIANQLNGVTRTACSAFGDDMNIWGGEVNLEGQQVSGNGTIGFSRRTSGGAVVSQGTLIVRPSTSGPFLHGISGNVGILLSTNTEMFLYGNENYSVLRGGYAAYWNAPSGRGSKKNEKKISFENVASAREGLMAVESKQWNYKNERVPGEAVPAKRKVRQRIAKRDQKGMPVLDVETKAPVYEIVESDALDEPIHKPHFFPIAEDVQAVLPELVRDAPAIEGGLGIDIRDFVGFLWQVCREQEQELRKLRRDVNDLKPAA
ncbi:MAG: hypothetical protein WC054_00795 [Candidatus Nanopelagicales bacterium]